MCARALNVLQWINSWFHFRPLLRYRCMYLSRFKFLNRRLVSISLKSVLIKWKQYIVVSIKRLLNVISAFALNATDIVSYCRRMRFYCCCCCCCCIFPLFSKRFKPFQAISYMAHVLKINSLLNLFCWGFNTKPQSCRLNRL